MNCCVKTRKRSRRTQKFSSSLASLSHLQGSGENDPETYLYQNKLALDREDDVADKSRIYRNISITVLKESKSLA